MIGFGSPQKFSPGNSHLLPICESFLPRKFPAIRYLSRISICFWDSITNLLLSYSNFEGEIPRQCELYIHVKAYSGNIVYNCFFLMPTDLMKGLSVQSSFKHSLPLHLIIPSTNITFDNTIGQGIYNYNHIMHNFFLWRVWVAEYMHHLHLQVNLEWYTRHILPQRTKLLQILWL